MGWEGTKIIIYFNYPQSTQGIRTVSDNDIKYRSGKMICDMVKKIRNGSFLKVVQSQKWFSCDVFLVNNNFFLVKIRKTTQSVFWTKQFFFW